MKNRLKLRKMNVDDAVYLKEIFSDPIAMEHYPSTKNYEETLSWMVLDYGLWKRKKRESS